jgi:hypothetical protein
MVLHRTRCTGRGLAAGSEIGCCVARTGNTHLCFLRAKKFVHRRDARGFSEQFDCYLRRYLIVAALPLESG